MSSVDTAQAPNNSSRRDADERDVRQFFRRVGRVLKLDPRVFDEVEGDPAALPQAAAIVLVAGVAGGVFDLASGGGPGLVASLAGAIVLWLLATSLLTGVSARWVHGTTDFHEMLRTLGFAAAPLWLLAPGFFLQSRAHAVVAVLLHVWAIAAAVIAVRQALDVGTARALAACGITLAVAIVLLFLLGAFGIP